MKDYSAVCSRCYIALSLCIMAAIITYSYCIITRTDIHTYNKIQKSASYHTLFHQLKFFLSTLNDLSHQGKSSLTK